MRAVRRFVLVLVPLLLVAACGDDSPTTPGAGDQLVVFFTFDGDAMDRSGQGNHGTPQGGATVDGALVTALNGSDHLILPGAVLDGAIDLTFAAWVRLDVIDGNSHQLVSGASATEHNEFGIWYRGTDEEWVVSVYDQARPFASDDRIEDGAWHHLAVTRQGDTGRLYLDGALVDTRGDISEGPLDIEDAGLVLGQDQDVVGGGFESDEGWGGAVDNVRIYRRALNAAEVGTLAAESR